jgi:hypothetical protein
VLSTDWKDVAEFFTLVSSVRKEAAELVCGAVADIITVYMGVVELITVCSGVAEIITV